MKRSKPACRGRKTPVNVSDERVQGRFTLLLSLVNGNQPEKNSLST